MDEEDWVVRGEKGGEAHTTPPLFISSSSTHSREKAEMWRLESEKQQKGHHETEKPHGFGEGETQNGVGEELLLEGRVPCVADDEGAEDGADTGAGSGHAHRGSAGADVLGRRVDIHSPRGCLERANWDDAEGGSRQALVSRERRRLGAAHWGGSHVHLGRTDLAGDWAQSRSGDQSASGRGGSSVSHQRHFSTIPINFV